MFIHRYFSQALILFSITSTVFAATAAPAAAAPAAPVNPSTDPATIVANADRLKAENDRMRVAIENRTAETVQALNLANAARQWASVRYLEDLRNMLNKEYAEIEAQTARVRRLQNELEWNRSFVERIRMGHTDPHAFKALINLLAGASEFAPIRDTLTRKVDVLPKINFIPNDDETGTAIAAQDYPGGDVRRLLLFVKRNNYSFEPLEDAHWIVLDALASVVGDAINRVLRLEQEIQGARAARINEVFSKP